MINIQELSSLFDLSGLSLIDNDTDRVIITDVNKLYFDINNDTKFKEALADLIVTNLTGKISTGDIVLFADDEFNRKIYCLIRVVCGKIVPYILYDVDYQTGNEWIANFTQSDVELLATYPMFSEKEELIFFICSIGFILAENSTTSNRALFKNVTTYLDKGFWAAHTDGYYASVEEISNRLGLRKITDVLYEKDGKYLAFYDYNLYGSYELVKEAYCEIAKNDETNFLIFTRAFSSIFSASDTLENMLMTRLSDLENDIALANKPKIIPKDIEQVTEELVKRQEKTVDVIDDDFFKKADEIFEKEEKEVKKTKKKQKIAPFEVQSEVSEQEKDIAINETIMKPIVKIAVPKIRKQRNAEAAKVSEAILSNTTDSYPSDWDYVYTIEETSRLYNPTIGQIYDEITGTFIAKPDQVRGMNIYEWNAYFYAHPELNNLVDMVIGHLGGLSMSESELKDEGYLLYNPKKLKLDYIHEYVTGNVYKLIDEFEVVKDSVIKIYGESFYDKQMDILLSKRPPIKSITSADEKNVPFIHPLDEIIIDYTINNAAGITFYNNQNTSLMRAEGKRLENEIATGKIKREEYDLLYEEFGGKIQALSISVYFMDWLGQQIGKLAGYGMPDIDLVNNLYFYGLSYNGYADALYTRGLVIVPQDKKVTDIVSYSDYYEAKDSAKRFVNDLFQEFLISEINEDDRNKIEYLWNKRYNGYVTTDVWKLPIFIRHSKYFKNRNFRRKLGLSEIQISGIKFATIDNSSIMAHEVGYGKTLIAIGYMSHCFETGQASNFLVTVPKTLYVNRKWREEIYGNYDQARNIYNIGAVPIYNIIELGNFSTSEIYGKGDSQYKEYTDDEQDKINELFQLFTEIGAKEAGKRVSKSQGTAALPTSPYNYRMPVVNSNYSWAKLIDTVLPKIDKHLFNRSLGNSFEENNAIINLISAVTLGKTAKEKTDQLYNLSLKIIETKWFYRKHLALFGIDIEFKGISNYDDRTRKEFDSFSNKEWPYQYERDENGKTIKEEYYDQDGELQTRPKRRPWKDIVEEYFMSVLEDLHSWLTSVIQKMADFAIYEYGVWKFTNGSQNIILATKEALQNLGFSSNYINGIVDVVKEITTYKSEENFDLQKTVSVRYIDDNGKEKVFKRNPEKVLQKQLQEMINKISVNMTEEGPRGKFFLENLKIDGFILDEAHIAKKIFTNVKTDASVKIYNQNGEVLSIKTTSHDVRGGTAPEQALAVFGICQYIRSIGNKKPVMLLTATPFSNQPTEIFSMLSLVGINQLREYGISNIKNFFDLFLKESLKYDFNQNGDFIKRITVEEFRNKELLVNLIWSVMDIRRESSLDKALTQQRYLGDKPIRIVFPKLNSESSMSKVELQDDSNIDEDLSAIGKETLAIINKTTFNTCSIVDQNDAQKSMMADIEKVVAGVINPKTNLEYTFDDVCPNVAIYNELEKEKIKVGKTEEEEEREAIVSNLRNILNTNIRRISNGINVNDYGDALSALPKMTYGQLIFVGKDIDGKWRIYQKTKSNKRGSSDFLKVFTDEDTVQETLKEYAKKASYGVTFKALGMSRAIALSPYLFRCNDLPEPTPENIIKYSPKIEYLVKALKSVKDYHLNNIPEKIKDFEKELKELKAINNKSQEDYERIIKIQKELPQLEAAREVSGQVIYMNMIRFRYYYRDAKGKAIAKDFNLAELIKQYLVNKGWFSQDEVQIVSSNTNDKDKEDYIKNFQGGKIKVLFGTPAIKEGVDLQNKASTMYIMTPDWNPTDMRQVEGRIWRRDNENTFVRIVYVLLDQSVEIFIYAKLEEKSRRLQQIMKERNTIEELEEMSLNPNETKVALASDPEKRADIITKLSKAILLDQRNKINKSREEVNRVADNLDVVYNNIEIIKNQYMLPYSELAPQIEAKINDFKMTEIIDKYVNNKNLFLPDFAREICLFGANTLNGILSINEDEPNVYLNSTLLFSLSLIYNKPTMEATLLFLTVAPDMSVIQDILNGFELIIENRDKLIAQFKNQNQDQTSIYSKTYTITYDMIDELMPMKHSAQIPENQKLLNQMLCGSFYLGLEPRLYKGATILFCYTDEMRAKLLAVVKEIKELQANGKNIGRYDIRELFENLSVSLTEDFYDFARKSPLVRPENYPPYEDYRNQKTKYSNMTPYTSDEFDSFDLMSKLDKIATLYYQIDIAFSTFNNVTINQKRAVLSKKNKTPVKAEVLVDLGLAYEDKTEQSEVELQFQELFRPILKMKNLLRDVEQSFLKSRGMSIDDLPVLVQQYNGEYDEMTKKIELLDASRIKLIEKFKKLIEYRKTVNIDQIVAKFAESNTYLESKLQSKD